MTKKLVVSASLLAKSQVAAYTRKDGTMVQSHDNGRQAAAPEPAAAASRASARQQLEQSRQSKLKEKLSAGGSIEDGEAKAAGFKSASHATAKLGGSAAPKLAVRASAPKPAAAKTGSAAPAKMKNVGTDKWPLHAKTSDALGAKHPDGSTHHIGGFEPPTHGKGDHLIHHDGKTFSYSGKSGKNMKTGEASYEYRAGDSGEHRAWVTHSGHLMND